MPATQIPQGTWLIGIGLIMLGVGAVRHFNGIKVIFFSVTLGIFALAAGLGDLLDVKHWP